MKDDSKAPSAAKQRHYAESLRTIHKQLGVEGLIMLVVNKGEKIAIVGSLPTDRLEEISSILFSAAITAGETKFKEFFEPGKVPVFIFISSPPVKENDEAKYDKLAIEIQEDLGAVGVAVLVEGGIKGNGFTALMSDKITKIMPERLRHMARHIETQQAISHSQPNTHKNPTLN